MSALNKLAGLARRLKEIGSTSITLDTELNEEGKVDLRERGGDGLLW